MNNLDFYAISYQSDSSIVKGITEETKKEEVFPVVIFNRGGNANFTELEKIEYNYDLMKFGTDQTFSDKKEELSIEIIKCFNKRL